MGNIVNPISYRLGVSHFWSCHWCFIKEKNYSYLIFFDLLLLNFFNNFFLSNNLIKSYCFQLLNLFIFRTHLKVYIIFNLQIIHKVFAYILKKKIKNQKINYLNLNSSFLNNVLRKKTLKLNDCFDQNYLFNFFSIKNIFNKRFYFFKKHFLLKKKQKIKTLNFLNSKKKIQLIFNLLNIKQKKINYNFFLFLCLIFIKKIKKNFSYKNFLIFLNFFFYDQTFKSLIYAHKKKNKKNLIVNNSEDKYNFFIFFFKIKLFFLLFTFFLSLNFKKLSINLKNYNFFYLLTTPQINANFLCNLIIKQMEHTQLKTSSNFFYLLGAELKENENILGYKISLIGRIGRQQRASQYITKFGSVPLNTISVPLDFSQKFTITRFGLVCIRVWIQYESVGLDKDKNLFLQI